MSMRIFNSNLCDNYKNTVSLSPSQIESAARLISALNPSQKSILSLLLRFSKRYSKVDPSQSYIGSKLNYTRESVSRIVGKLRRYKFLSTEQRFNDTLIYSISDIFKNEYFKSLVHKILPAVGFSVALISCQTVILGCHTKLIDLTELNSNSNSNSNVHTTICKSKLQVHTDSNSNSDSNSNIAIARVENMEYKFKAAIENIKSLNLTIAGKAKLTAYHDSALMHADRELSKKSGIQKPYHFFAKIAHDWCKKNNIEPNWKLVREIEAQLNIPDSADMLLPGKKSMLGTESINDGEKSHNAGDNARYGFTGDGPHKPKMKSDEEWYADEKRKYEQMQEEINAGLWEYKKRLIPTALAAQRARMEYREKVLNKTAKHPDDDKRNWIEEYHKGVYYANNGKFPESKYFTVKQILELLKAKAVVYAKENKVDFPEAGIIFTTSAFKQEEAATQTTEQQQKEYFMQLLDEELAASPAAEAEKARLRDVAARMLDRKTPEPAVQYTDYSNEDEYGEALPWLP